MSLCESLIETEVSLIEKEVILNSQLVIGLYEEDFTDMTRPWARLRDEKMVDRDRLQEAVGLINNVLNNPATVTTMSELLNQRRQTSTGATDTAVDNEMRRLFRAGSSAAGGAAGSGTSSGATVANITGGLNVNQVMQPRFQTQRYFGGWASKSRKR